MQGINLKQALVAWNMVLADHETAREADGKFDGGEWSGPAYDKALERALTAVAEKYGVTVEELQEAIHEQDVDAMKEPMAYRPADADPMNSQWQKRYPNLGHGHLRVSVVVANDDHPAETQVLLLADRDGQLRVQTTDEHPVTVVLDHRYVEIDHWHDDGTCCECGSPYHCCCDCPSFRQGDETGLCDEDVNWLSGYRSGKESLIQFGRSEIGNYWRGQYRRQRAASDPLVIAYWQGLRAALRQSGIAIDTIKEQ